LADNEIELGLGIHGEKGVKRSALLPADEIAKQLVNRLVDDLGAAASSNTGVVLLINNLGATPLMELNIVGRGALRVLKARGLEVERAWCGTFLSAIDMAGCSISIMPVDAGRLARLDAATEAPAWVKVPAKAPAATVTKINTRNGPQKTAPGQGVLNQTLQATLQRIATALIKAEPRLTALDQAVGDGDLGISMSRAAQAVMDNLDSLARQPVDVALTDLSNLLRKVIAGSSGPFYAIGLSRASARLQQTNSWGAALDGACDAISELGGAGPGDRTMLDALYPAAMAFRATVDQGKDWREAVTAAAAAAEQGARATANLLPKRGRSLYLGERALGSPDPGAEALAVWLRAIAG
jgi:dihydroxyacetone kinase